MPAKKNCKIFVLDTSVILYDHHSVLSFDEHDIVIPITVLEEIDNFKTGNLHINFEARGFIRMIDELGQDHPTLTNWIPLDDSLKKGKIKVHLETSHDGKDATEVFGDKKNDHKILNTAQHIRSQFPTRDVVLVSKDINLRIKAKSLGLKAEDYETGKIKDIDVVYKGHEVITGIDKSVIDALYKEGWIAKTKEFPAEVFPNQYFILKNGRASALSYYDGDEDKIYLVEKRNSYGIAPRNAEQAFAMDAILNPKVRLVSLQGVAGTGKTLLALAGALEMRKNYRQIFLGRPIVPLSNKDIGYLPGDIGAKLNPYMEPLWDNLKFIQNQFQQTDANHKRIQEMLDKEKLLIQPLAYIRGRSFANIIFIIDEAQNLTPHEIKTIITRAGENCKLIFTGDVRQIDTPYLDAQSNGFSYMIDKLRGQKLFAHITLERGERSELANLANELL